MAGRRLELGFEGGAVLRITLDEDAVGALTGSLGSAGGWTSLAGEEDTYWVNLDELAYVRVPAAGTHRVGFGD